MKNKDYDGKTPKNQGRRLSSSLSDAQLQLELDYESFRTEEGQTSEAVDQGAQLVPKKATMAQTSPLDRSLVALRCSATGEFREPC